MTNLELELVVFTATLGQEKTTLMFSMSYGSHGAQIQSRFDLFSYKRFVYDLGGGLVVFQSHSYKLWNQRRGVPCFKGVWINGFTLDE